MKNFKYEKSPFFDISKKVKLKVLKEMEDKIKYEESTFFQRIAFSKFYFIFSILTFIFFIGWLMILLKKRVWKNKNIKLLKDLHQSDVYKIIFEETFNNVKVTKGINIPHYVINKYRGAGIPKDAFVSKINIGPTFKINKIELNTEQVLWVWTRSNGKGGQTYYAWKIYAYSNKILPKFNHFSLKMKESKLFSKRGNDLENTQFNKKFWYDYNDPQTARLFFPLSAQERWLDVIEKTKYNYKLANFDLYIDKGEYIIGKNPTQKSEYGNLYIDKITKNKKDYINTVYQNLIKDIEEITILFRLALINKYFFK